MIPIHERTTAAKRVTASTANMKPYKIRTKHNRAMMEIAKELTNGKGYIIASVVEMAERYGKLFDFNPGAPENDKLRVWAIIDSWNRCGTIKLKFAPI